jgi:two-component system sensor histidine kinase QseC
MIRSLRTRLFVGVTLAAALALAALAVAVDRSVARVLTEEFDRVLLQKARALSSMVEQQDADIHFDYQRADFPEFEASSHPAYFQIWLDGKTYQRSPSLSPSLDLPLTDAVAAQGASIILPDKSAGRLIRWEFQPFLEDADPHAVAAHPRPHGVVIVAQNTTSLDQTFGRIRLIVVSLCTAATLFLGAALLIVVRRMLAPVNHLAQQIESLSETDLRRLPQAHDLPLELRPVVARLNELLDKLAQAFDRERHFTADVAHELRTPLAGLLTTLEVCRSRPRDAVSYQAAIDKSLIMLHQMQALVERLLFLARAEGGQLLARREPIDLAALALECWSRYESTAALRKISLSIEQPEGLQALADAQLLAVVFSNLLDNALSYAAGATSIRLRIAPENGALRVWLSNTGHTLSAAELPHLFDRFWRKDSARAQQGIHAGIGLGLCKRLLELQAGTLAIGLDADTFTAEFCLPAAATEAPALTT